VSYKRLWLIVIAAALFSWLLLLSCSHSKSTGLPYNSNALSMSSGWTISDGEKNISENSDFDKTGWLKKQNKVILTKFLSDTSQQSICFTTIGYTVKAFIDERSIYSFGSSPDGNDVWGVKTHIIKIPDSGQDRTLRLEFSTNHPAYIAVSKYILLDGVLAITDSLLKSSLIEICFSLLYISIGVFILMYLVISLAFRFKRFDLSILMLAFIALFMGSRILLNISFITLHTGPEFVFWSENLLNLALPVPALLFVAADKGFKKSRLLVAMSAIQSLFLLAWLIYKIHNPDTFLLYWKVPLFILITVVFMATFIIEFMTGTGRSVVAAAVFTIIIASVVDAQIYFFHGNYYSMEYNLTIATFPVLILLIGKIVLNSVQREVRTINEITTLRVEGELLFENYNRIDQYIEETKKIWHDIDKHYSVIGRMVAEDKYDELKSYLKYMGHDMKETKSSYLCGNRLLNAILTDKTSEAENAGIKVSFSGNLPENLNIRGNDLCSLFVNMLDNAIEACNRIPCGNLKKIDIALGLNNDFIYFVVSNSSVGTPIAEGDEFVLSKGDKREHGYGISIMRGIARKYDGAFDIISSEGSFMVRAALKNSFIE